MPWPSGGPRLYWFSRRESDGKLEYRYATTFPENCGTPPSPTCTTNWSPGTDSSAFIVSSGLASNDAPAAAWYQDGAGINKFVLVYKDTANHLRFQTMTAVYLWGFYLDGWSSVSYVDSTEGIRGSPAAVAFDGRIYVYAIGDSDGLLKQWTLSPSGSWSGPATQQWDDGTDIQASFGIGVTNGYLQIAAGHENHLFAAIPEPSPQTYLDLAWKDQATGRWTKLGDGCWLGGITKIPTLAQPGLAYEPFDLNGSAYEGRFYLAFNLPMAPSCGPAYMTQSEGNRIDVSNYHRLAFDSVGYYATRYHCTSGPMTLLSDPSHGNNIRGAYTGDDSTHGHYPSFSPVADGIFNMDLKDQNDYSVIIDHLHCSLVMGTCE